MKNKLDSLILSQASDRWQKVARIIALVSEQPNNSTNFEGIEKRIHALVDNGKLEAKGDLSQWRHSEIRHAKPT